jgi:hypothetical protein
MKPKIRIFNGIWLCHKGYDYATGINPYNAWENWKNKPIRGGYV